MSNPSVKWTGWHTFFLTVLLELLLPGVYYVVSAIRNTKPSGWALFIFAWLALAISMYMVELIRRDEE